MKLSNKLGAGFGLLILLLVALLINHLFLVRQAITSSRSLQAISTRLTLSAAQQVKYLDQLEEATKKFITSRDARYVSLMDEAEGGFALTIDQLEAWPLTAEERTAVDRLAQLWRQFEEEAPRPNVMSVNLDATPLSARFDSVFEALRDQTRRVNRATQAAIAAEVSRSVDTAQAAERLSLVSLVLALALSVIVSYLIIRSITRPLNRLARATEAVAAGDFSYRVREKAGDEFSQLASGFNYMTRRLGELDRVKRDLLSHVSHELKTPLASMQEANQILLEGLPGSLVERQRRLLEMNVQSGRRLSSMISKLLDVSRMEGGAVGYDFEEHDLIEIVRRVVGAFRDAALTAGHQIEETYPKRPILVRCDRERVGQVVQNLVDNAAKFSPRDTPIRVQVTHSASPPAGTPGFARASLGWKHRPTGYAVLAVADEGPGVPNEHKQRIFEKFYQLSDGKQVPGRGVGLGLALSREVSDAHGGALWVVDNEPRGAVFYFVLGAASVEVEDATRSVAERKQT